MAPAMSAEEPRADSMTIDTVWDGSVPVLHVTGPLEASTVAALVAELARACAVRGNVVVDLASVPAADATGVAPIVAAARSLRDHGSCLVVRGADQSVHRLITMLDPTDAVDLS